MTAAGHLARVFLSRHPRETARSLDRSDAAEAARLLEAGAAEVAAETLQHVDPVQGCAILTCLPVERAADVLRAMPPSRAAAILLPLDAEARGRLLAAVSEDLAHALAVALDHPADSAARFMDPAVLAVPLELDAAEARRRVSGSAHRAHYYLFVVDAARRPVGVVNLRELLGASGTAPIASLMHSPVITIPSSATAVVIAGHPGWREFHAMPVVDQSGTLVGVVRHEALERIRSEELAPTTGGGVGVAMTEALWTVTANLVDEVATALRRRDDDD